MGALSVPRFLEAAEACQAAEERDEQAEWQRIAFGTWRVEVTLAGMFGAKADALPSFAAYLRQMGISDGAETHGS